MIHTTLALLALSAGLEQSVPSALKWQPDYAQAMTRASADKKPIAVFIGRGSNAVKRMTADGTISTDAAKVLATSYVCVYLDTDTTSGKDLASRFEMKEGLVISSPGGSAQAYRYAGAVPKATLTKELTAYATVGQPVTTIYAGEPPAKPVSVAPAGYVTIPGSCANGSCGQYVYPGTVYGGCANGRCPYQR